MTHLRKLMLEELERRNYAASTTRAYLRAVAELARYFHRSPDQLGPDHIRQYQAYLFRERKFQPNTVIQHLGGIRFFYIRTLKQSWSADLTPYPKKVLHLPSILSREEVNHLIEAAPTPFQRTLLMALYATGLRRAELARLKITDIDSSRSVIHVQGGKGRKDRDVMLSQNLLEALREHWRSLRRKPTVWVFPGNRWHTADHPISPKVIWAACREAAQRAGIRKEVHPHTLRHASAYYTTFPTRFILKIIRLGQAGSTAVYGPGGPLSPVAAQPAMPNPSGRLSTEHTPPHVSPVECVLG